MELRSSTKESRHEHYCRWQGKLHPDRTLLRRPWIRIASRADSWVAPQWGLLGETDGRTARRGASRDHVRPARLRSLEQDGSRLSLRHIRGRSRQAVEEAQSQEGRS